MARRIMRMASSSTILGLRRSPSEVGRRMQPKPSAEAFQSSRPKLRYCIVILPHECFPKWILLRNYASASQSIPSPFTIAETGEEPGTMTRTNEQSAAALAGKPSFSIISNEKLLQLYAARVKCRALEERVQILFPRSKLTGKRGSASREAVAVGVAIDLLPEDTVAASPGDLVVNFIWNEVQAQPLNMIFARLNSRAARPSRAAQFKLAAVAAQANKAAKNGKIALAFSSNGSGFSLEALKAAGDRQLPILFVCQSRLPAEQPRGKKQTGAAE